MGHFVLFLSSAIVLASLALFSSTPSSSSVSADILIAPSARQGACIGHPTCYKCRDPRHKCAKCWYKSQDRPCASCTPIRGLLQCPYPPVLDGCRITCCQAITSGCTNPNPFYDDYYMDDEDDADGDVF